VGLGWCELDAEASRAFPPVRAYHAMAYDAARGQTVLFSGYNGSQFPSDTWVWDGQDWTQKTPLSSPSASAGGVMTFDSGLGEVIFQGGYLSDTWAWDGTNWTWFPPPTSSNPSTRLGSL